MKIFISVIIVVLLFNYPAHSQTNDSLVSFIEHFSDSMLTIAKQPGMIISITCGDSIIYEKAKGFSNIETKELMDKTMRFRIGSVTKTFTTTVLLQLVDEGKVKLDDPIDKFFPQIHNAKIITIRMLGDMSSGLKNYSEMHEFDDSMKTFSRKKWKPEELVEISTRNGTDFEPGKGWHYSNTNTVLIGMIIEKITGNSLEEEIRRRIIDKLNLNETELPVEPELIGKYPRGYNEDDTTLTEPLTDLTIKYDPSWAWAAGAMISSVKDLKIYLKALTEGKLVSTQSQADRFKWVLDKAGLKYGFGIFMVGNDYLGHNGSYPGFHNVAVHSPKSNCTIIIFYNTQSNRDPDDFLKAILPMMK
jgi:D-alanyl-D-alanine carboxypeptidase